MSNVVLVLNGYSAAFSQNDLCLEQASRNLCMGNQENAPKDDTVLATTTRLFRGRVVEDVDWKTSEPLLASTPAVGLSSILGRNPTLGNHITAVNGVDLTKLAPPHQNPPRRGRRISKTHIAKA